MLLTGCINSRPDNIEQELNIYSARHYDIDKAMIEAFEKEKGIIVNVIEGKGDELIERMIREKNNPQADLFLTVGAETLSTALSEELFQNIDLKDIKEVLDSQFYGNQWVAVTKRARIMVYDKGMPQPSIKTYDDLTNDEFKQTLLVRSSTSSYNIAMLASLIQTKGTNYALSFSEGVVHNMARKPTGNDRDQIHSIVSGLGKIAIINTYYLILLENSSDPSDREIAAKMRVVFPENTLMNLSYAAILKKAENTEHAQMFIDYLLASEQQIRFMNENGEFPVRNDITLNPTIQSWGEFSVAPVNYETLGEFYAQAVMMFDQVGWK